MEKRKNTVGVMTGKCRGSVLAAVNTIARIDGINMDPDLSGNARIVRDIYLAHAESFATKSEFSVAIDIHFAPIGLDRIAAVESTGGNPILMDALLGVIKNSSINLRGRPKYYITTNHPDAPMDIHSLHGYTCIIEITQSNIFSHIMDDTHIKMYNPERDEVMDATIPKGGSYSLTERSILIFEADAAVYEDEEIHEDEGITHMSQPSQITPERKNTWNPVVIEPEPEPEPGRKKRSKQTALGAYGILPLGNEDLPMNEDAVLDQQTRSNSLYDTYSDELKRIFRDGGRIAIVAPTGSGKTRLGMLHAVQSMFANVKRKQAVKFAGKDPKSIPMHLSVICVPYRVIAANYFQRLINLRCAFRPCLGKMLVGDNPMGNSRTLYFKRRPALMHCGVSPDTYKSWFSQELYGESMETKAFGAEFDLAKQLMCDFVVGTYEMILAFLQNPAVSTEVAKGNIVIHGVFDEFQEALKSRESRFVTAASLFDRLTAMSTSMVITSGSYSMLTARDNTMTNILNNATLKYDIKIVDSPSKVVIRHSRRQDKILINYMARMPGLIKPTTNYADELENIKANYPELMHMADAVCHPEKGTTIVMLNDTWKVDTVMNAILITVYILQQCTDESSSEWMIPLYVTSTMEGHKGLWMNSENERIADATYEDPLFGDKPVPIAQAKEQVEARLAVLREKEDELGNDDVFKEELKSMYAKRRAIDAKIRSYKPLFVLDSNRAYNHVTRNIATQSSTAMKKKSCPQGSYTLRTYDICEIWDMDAPKPWLAYKPNPIRCRHKEIANMMDVYNTCLQALVFINNAVEDYTNELEDELQRVRRGPRIWLATQKIGVGADLPGVRRVIQLQNTRHVMTNELTDQVLGRCDRERMGRLMFAETKAAKDDALDADDEEEDTGDAQETYMALDNSIYFAKLIIMTKANKKRDDDTLQQDSADTSSRDTGKKSAAAISITARGPIMEYIDNNMAEIGDKDIKFEHLETAGCTLLSRIVGVKSDIRQVQGPDGALVDAVDKDGNVVFDTTERKLETAIKHSHQMCQILNVERKVSMKVTQYINDEDICNEVIASEFLTRMASTETPFTLPFVKSSHYISGALGGKTMAKKFIDIARDTKYIVPSRTDINYVTAISLALDGEPVKAARRDGCEFVLQQGFELVNTGKTLDFANSLIDSMKPEELFATFIALVELMTQKPSRQDRLTSSGKKARQFALSDTLAGMLQSDGVARESINFKLRKPIDDRARSKYGFYETSTRTGFEYPNDELYKDTGFQGNIDTSTPWLRYTQLAMFIRNPTPIVAIVCDRNGQPSSYRVISTYSPFTLKAVTARVMEVITYTRSASFSTLMYIASNKQLRSNKSRSLCAMYIRQLRNVVRTMDSKWNTEFDQDFLSSHGNLQYLVLYKIARKLWRPVSALFANPFKQADKLRCMAEFFDDPRIEEGEGLIGCWNSRCAFEVGDKIPIKDEWYKLVYRTEEEAETNKKSDEANEVLGEEYDDEKGDVKV